MKSRIYKWILIFTILGGIIFINSCEKEKIFYNDTVNELHSIMEQWYYWIDSIPDINPADYSSPPALLEGMRFSSKDKWSYITTKDAHSQFYEEGTYVGYGFGYAADSDDNIRITFLFENSDLNDFGVNRGWIIREINGTSIDVSSNISYLLGEEEIGVSNTLKLESPTGTIITETFQKKLISMNTVGYDDVIDAGSSTVGYFVFKSFISPSIKELSDVFTDFRVAGIDELVIDLRYNGGGSLSVVEHLASLIIPDNVNGQVFVKYVHNNDRSNQNENIYFEQDANSLRLNKVYFIAGKGSASASEVIINSLEPYIDVYIVGDDTYGKPVGMYSFYSTISNLVYVPISFKLLNANDYGGYYDGLATDSYVEDDVTNDFGVGEAVLDEVIYHIENGSFSSTKSSFDIYRKPFKEIRSLKDEIGAI
ncbi:S41 family peptidase [Bacteroidota bacterium]